MEKRRSKTEKADAALIAAYDAGRASVRGCE